MFFIDGEDTNAPMSNHEALNHLNDLGEVPYAVIYQEMLFLLNKGRITSGQANQVMLVGRSIFSCFKNA